MFDFNFNAQKMNAISKEANERVSMELASACIAVVTEKIKREAVKGVFSISLRASDLSFDFFSNKKACDIFRSYFEKKGFHVEIFISQKKVLIGWNKE